MFKKIAKSIVAFSEMLNSVLTASHFARAGDYATARKLMLPK